MGSKRKEGRNEDTFRDTFGCLAREADFIGTNVAIDIV